MSQPSADGAAAAAGYFMSLYAYANATGELSEWDAMSAPGCTFCAGVREDVESRRAAGVRNIGEVHVRSAAATEVDAGRWYSARLQVLIGESEDVKDDGSIVEVHPPEDHEIDVVMTWTEASWIIDEVGPASGPTA